MIFDFSTVVLLIIAHCCLFPHPTHRIYSSTIYLCYSRSFCERPCCHLSPGILSRTHSLTSSRIFIPNQRSFHFRFITALFPVLFFFLGLSHPYSCRNPSILRKRCTLAGRFLLAVRYSCLSTPFARRRGIVSRHYVFLGSPTAFAAGASKSKTKVRPSSVRVL